VAPKALTYEELADDPTRSQARVLDYIGSTSPPSVEPSTSKLATELNEDWVARFRQERTSAS
jgi:LPS sulfotransferase NodH